MKLGVKEKEDIFYYQSVKRQIKVRESLFMYLL